MPTSSRCLLGIMKMCSFVQCISTGPGPALSPSPWLLASGWPGQVRLTPADTRNYWIAQSQNRLGAHFDQITTCQALPRDLALSRHPWPRNTSATSVLPCSSELAAEGCWWYFLLMAPASHLGLCLPYALQLLGSWLAENSLPCEEVGGHGRGQDNLDKKPLAKSFVPFLRVLGVSPSCRCPWGENSIEGYSWPQWPAPWWPPMIWYDCSTATTGCLSSQHSINFTLCFIKTQRLWSPGCKAV